MKQRDDLLNEVKDKLSNRYYLEQRDQELVNDCIDELLKAINYSQCCETSIADFQIDDKITFKQHRSGIVTDVYINELQVKDLNGNYKTIGKSDVIEKH